jgi:hypothetical protein
MKQQKNLLLILCGTMSLLIASCAKDEESIPTTPTEEYRIIDISYEMEADDEVTRDTVLTGTSIVENNTDTPVSTTYQDSLVEDRSTFYAMEGMNGITLATDTILVRIPDLVNSKKNAVAQSSYKLPYVVDQTLTEPRGVNETGPVNVPPHQTFKMELYIVKDVGQVTYTAKLVGTSHGGTLYLKGKWQGSTVVGTQVVISPEVK